SLDPIFVSGLGGQELSALLYTYLVKLDAQGRMVPDAALEVPTRANGGISRDGRVITYHLRPGIRFSDGSPLTSADVKATLEAIAAPESDAPSRIGFDDIAVVTAPDPLTVRVHLGRPYAPILLYLCAPGNAVPILPHAIIAGKTRLANLSISSAPVGSGPYVLHRWRRSDYLELDANPAYFAGPAKIKHLFIRFVPSATTAVEAVRAGEADAFINADESQHLMISTLKRVRIESVPLDGTGALIFNTRSPGIRDAAIRRAIAAAFDARSIVDKTLMGRNRSRNTGRGLFQWAYDPTAFTMPAYDPSAAANVLRRHKLALTLVVRDDRPSQLSIATQIQAQERAAGVDVSIRRYPVSELVAPDGPLYGGYYDLALFTFIGNYDPDVTDQFSCDRIPPRGFNKPRYCNPALDALMKKAAGTYDRTERIALYRPIQEILARDLPLDALFQANAVNIFPEDLRGESNAPSGPFWNVANWELSGI
ncbi:MAG TPA: peptide ABC transporter substrate-binding protein, partial [Candidatus Baltobacteraceae bacterium]|nr:peptide ABC transporter substrate-binding protein [Candidatus Baltobacteraceae bacterium]